MNSDNGRVTVWLAVALGFHIFIAIISAYTLASTVPGLTFRSALHSTAPEVGRLSIFGPSYYDSWGPMLFAYHTRTTDPTYRLYDVFFVDRVKFQYPPSSLLIFDLVPRSVTVTPDRKSVNEELSKWLHILSLIAVIGTVLVSAIILEVRLKQLNPDTRVRWAGMTLRALLGAGLGLTYYPLMKGHQLGQIQVFLGFLTAVAILSYLLGWEVLSGVCLGFCCLVKPQFGILLLWGLLRRRWRFTFGFGGVFFLGLGLAVGRFGAADHLDYVRVLRAISNTGEIYWPNQSVNGLVNRLLGNGDPIAWTASEFAPYHPWVHAVTVLSSLAILGVALVPWRLRHPPVDRPVDMLVALVAATMASPVAWEHHYGMFLPIFAAILPQLVRTRPMGRLTVPLFAVSYLAMAGVIYFPQAIFDNRWRGLFGSHLFFGALILFALLLRLRRASEAGAADTPAVPSSEVHEVPQSS